MVDSRSSNQLQDLIAMVSDGVSKENTIENVFRDANGKYAPAQDNAVRCKQLAVANPFGVTSDVGISTSLWTE